MQRKSKKFYQIQNEKQFNDHHQSNNQVQSQGHLHKVDLEEPSLSRSVVVVVIKIIVVITTTMMMIIVIVLLFNSNTNKHSLVSVVKNEAHVQFQKLYLLSIFTSTYKVGAEKLIVQLRSLMRDASTFEGNHPDFTVGHRSSPESSLIDIAVP